MILTLNWKDGNTLYLSVDVECDYIDNSFDHAFGTERQVDFEVGSIWININTRRVPIMDIFDLVLARRQELEERFNKELEDSYEPPVPEINEDDWRKDR